MSMKEERDGVRRPNSFRHRFPNRLQDSLQHRFLLLEDIVITDSEELITLSLQTLLPLLIVFATFIVTFSVEFDDQPSAGMVKVDDILINWMLPPELFTLQATVAKQVPQLLFRPRHLFAQGTRSLLSSRTGFALSVHTNSIAESRCHSQSHISAPSRAFSNTGG